MYSTDFLRSQSLGIYIHRTILSIVIFKKMVLFSLPHYITCLHLYFIAFYFKFLSLSLSHTHTHTLAVDHNWTQKNREYMRLYSNLQYIIIN